LAPVNTTDSAGSVQILGIWKTVPVHIAALITAIPTVFIPNRLREIDAPPFLKIDLIMC